MLLCSCLHLCHMGRNFINFPTVKTLAQKFILPNTSMDICNSFSFAQANISAEIQNNNSQMAPTSKTWLVIFISWNYFFIIQRDRPFWRAHKSTSWLPFTMPWEPTRCRPNVLFYSTITVWHKLDMKAVDGLGRYKQHN